MKTDAPCSGQPVKEHLIQAVMHSPADDDHESKRAPSILSPTILSEHAQAVCTALAAYRMIWLPAHSSAVHHLCKQSRLAKL